MKQFKLLFIFLFFNSIYAIYPQVIKPNSILDLCGSDNRVASTNAAVGRIYTIPTEAVSTGWILSDGRIVTAAHTFEGGANSNSYIEFNVPPTSSDCSTLGHPSAANKYMININSVVKSTGTNVGDDWAIFTVYPNSQTGLTPIEAQHAYLFVEQTTSPGDLQIIGFGSSGNCPLNYAQQSGTGSYQGLNGTIVKYNVDATPGNSGSPIINLNTGNVIGIHTTGTCGSLGYNEGTSTYNSSFWSALHLPLINVTVDEKLSGSNAQVGTIGRWSGSSFSPRINPGNSISAAPGSIEILQGDQAIYSGQKYNNWNRNNNFDIDVINHHQFVVRYSDNKYTANFLPTYSGITIQSSIPEIGSNSANNSIGFSDPWLIDYADPDFGNITRNEGTIAPYRQQASPFAPDLSSSFNGYVYKGVFLNQGFVNGQWIPPYYSVSIPNQSISLGGINHSLFIWYWSGTNAIFQSLTTSPTPVVFTNSSATVTANVKVTQLSNNATAYSNNSQRKIVRTQDGWLHMVYESLGHVWLEQSSDNGSTWFIGNGGQPLDNGAGKCPSIDWMYDSNNNINSIVVAFQQQNGNTYTIQYTTCQYSNGTYVNNSSPNKSKLLYTETTDPYTTNANPNISWGKSSNNNLGSFVLTFERKSGSTAGINWIYGMMDERGIIGPNSQPYNQPCDGSNNNIAGPIFVAGTNSNSINASVNLNKSYTNPDFYVVYQQYVSSNSNSIYDVQLSCVQANPNTDPWIWTNLRLTKDTLSSTTGRSNYKPSMVQTDKGDIRVCWIRDQNGDPVNAPYAVNAVYYNSAVARPIINITGMNVKSVSLNLRDDNASSYYAWSQYWNNSWSNYICNGSSYVTLGTTGQDLQLSNGPLTSGNTNMYTTSFYPFTAPYYFQNAGAIGTKVLKSNGGNINIGRGVALAKESSQFSYSLKSIMVNNNNIKFVDVPESKTDTSSVLTRRMNKSKYNWNLDSLNMMLVSEPFSLNGTQDFTIVEQAGLADTTSAAKMFGKNGYISYKLELLDNATNKVIGTIKESKYSSGNISQCKLLTSRIKADKGITGEVRLRITISTNIDNLEKALVNEYGTLDESTLTKSTIQELALDGLDVVKEYALSQNYPNPFNPVTTINYQLPKDGHITLKVYDILGKEVKTLVNDYKSQGRYSVEFNASNLASGTYIYELRVNDYTSVKKLILLK